MLGLGSQRVAGQEVVDSARISCSHFNFGEQRHGLETLSWQDGLGPRGRCGVGAKDYFTFQMVAVVFQHEAQHIGRPIMVQVPAIEFVNRFIVHDRETYGSR